MEAVFEDVLCPLQNKVLWRLPGGWEITKTSLWGQCQYTRREVLLGLAKVSEVSISRVESCIGISARSTRRLSEAVWWNLWEAKVFVWKLSIVSNTAEDVNALNFFLISNCCAFTLELVYWPILGNASYGLTSRSYRAFQFHLSQHELLGVIGKIKL